MTVRTDEFQTSTPTLLAKPTVHIVGFAASWADTPWGEPDAENWGMNALHKLAPDKPFHRWYQLHDIETHHTADRDEHVGWLANCGIPVYMWPEHADKWRPTIPTAVPFPRLAITDHFGRYFTNTVSWMVAHAIWEGRTKIGVYGIDMAQDSEYCVTPDSRILRSDLSWVYADQIRVGDELLAFDENPPIDTTYREFRSATVEAVTTLMQPTYALEMADGTKLTSSGLHRWLTTVPSWEATERLHGPLVTQDLADEITSKWERHKRGGRTIQSLSDEYGLSWSAVQRIVSGNLDISKSRRHRLYKVFDVWDTDRSWGAGFLSAAFDGEGHLSMRPRSENRSGTLVHLGFSQRPNAMSAVVEQELDARGFAWGSYNNNGTNMYRIKGGRKEAMRLLGTIRPPRLLENFNPDYLGVMHKSEAVEIVGKTYLGEQPVIGIQTTTGTMIVDGFASHNSHQRPSCEYFLGWAAGSGVEVVVPPTSDLLKAPYLYGAEDGNPLRVKMESRLKELQGRQSEVQGQIQNLQNQMAQAQAALNQIAGAVEDTQYYLRAWTQPMVSDGKVPT